MYNATVYTIENGKRVSAFVAAVSEVGGKVQMLRSNALQCTGVENKVGFLKIGSDLANKYGSDEVALYHVYYSERHPNDVLEIVQDNCDGYRNFFNQK